MKKKKLLTEHEEELMALFYPSEEFKIIKKMIDNGIVNLYQTIAITAMEDLTDKELGERARGIGVAIRELNQFKSNVRIIADRVSKRKKKG